MSFIRFESASEKEKLRQELRDARQELLTKAKQNAEDRSKAAVVGKFRGENQWMHPAVEDKLEKQSSTPKKSKRFREKKSKRERKKSKKQKSDKKEKKKKRNKAKSPHKDNSDSDCTSPDSDESSEWVEKKGETSLGSEDTLKRDGWMTGSFLLPTYSKQVESKDEEKTRIDSYDPSKSSRELNPYWKHGGTGLPTFQRPKDYDDEDKDIAGTYRLQHKNRQGNWRKKQETVSSREQYVRERSSSSPESEQVSKCAEKSSRSRGSPNFLTDQQMNELGAKLIKAEIMGNDEVAKELKEKLNKARHARNKVKENTTLELTTKVQRQEQNEEHVLLTRTDSKGVTRPLLNRPSLQSDPYSKRVDSKRKKHETHEEGKRVKYFPDDDRYDIKQMFEREKYATSRDSEEQFVKIAQKQKNSKDDLEDIFADNVRREITESEASEKEKKGAIQEHEKLSRVLESCDKCFDSSKMQKHLLVSMGSTAYLALPWYEGLQPGHCLIVPMEHVPCSTRLDENNWAEITQFRKALTRMFQARSMDVVFFEIARYLNKSPHMVIHCVPSKNFEMAPFYFKKAIQESEYMWSTNKQLITLRDRDVRRAIPKGLPYFWVHFGMDSGFAHVIEDQQQFPANFAEEVIGGMLELDARMWRKPRKERNSIEKVKQFADWWKPYDCTM